MLGDRERVHGIVQLVALRRAELLIQVGAVEQAFKGQLSVGVGVALRDLVASTVKEPETRAGKRGVFVGVELDDFQVASDRGVVRCDGVGLSVFGDFHGDRGTVEHKALQRRRLLQSVAAEQQPGKGQLAVSVCVALFDKIASAVRQNEVNAGHGLASFLVQLQHRHVPAGKLIYCGHGYCLPALCDRYRVEHRIKDKMAQRFSLGIVVFSQRKIVKADLSVAVRLAAAYHLPVAVIEDETRAGYDISVFVHLA